MWLVPFNPMPSKTTHSKWMRAAVAVCNRCRRLTTAGAAEVGRAEAGAAVVEEELLKSAAALIHCRMFYSRRLRDAKAGLMN